MNEKLLGIDCPLQSVLVNKKIEEIKKWCIELYEKNMVWWKSSEVDLSKRNFNKLLLWWLLTVLIPSFSCAEKSSSKSNYNIDTIKNSTEMKEYYDAYYYNNPILRVVDVRLYTSTIKEVSNKQVQGIKNYHNKLSINWKAKYRTLSNILDLPYSLVLWLGIQETTFIPNSESNKWAKDLFQIMDVTYNGLNNFYNNWNTGYGWEEWYFSRLKDKPEFVKIHNTDPKVSISLAYLAYLYNIKYKKNINKALRHYNSWNPKWNSKETRKYVDENQGVPVHLEFVQKLLDKKVII